MSIRTLFRTALPVKTAIPAFVVASPNLVLVQPVGASLTFRDQCANRAGVVSSNLSLVPLIPMAGSVSNWLGVLVLLGAFLPSAHAGDCNNPSGILAAQFESVKPPLNSGKLFSRAVAYLEAECFGHARAELKKANAALEKEKLDPRTSEPGVRSAAQAGLADFISAMELSKRGQTAAARKQLLKLLSENRSTDVLWRTTLALGRLLTLEANDNEWKEFEPYLNQLESGGSFWQVDSFRMHHEVQMGHTAAAIRKVSAELGTELPMQRRFALQILLGELLLADGRSANALILCANFEQEIGTELLELELRLRYLQLCADASRKETVTEADSRIQRTLRVYESAIAKFKKEM